MVYVVDKVALSRLFSEFFRFPSVTQYSTTVLSPSIIEHEVCDSPDQAAHYNTLGPKLGASALTRHLDYPGVRYYHHYYYNKFRSRVSSGSIVSDYGLDDRAIGVRSPAGAKDFSSNLCVQTGSGAHPASCPKGTGDPFPGAKRGRGVTMTTHPI
jgi:hypothetical protein